MPQFKLDSKLASLSTNSDKIGIRLTTAQLKILEKITEKEVIAYRIPLSDLNRTIKLMHAYFRSKGDKDFSFDSKKETLFYIKLKLLEYNSKSISDQHEILKLLKVKSIEEAITRVDMLQEDLIRAKDMIQIHEYKGANRLIISKLKMNKLIKLKDSSKEIGGPLLSSKFQGSSLVSEIPQEKKFFPEDRFDDSEKYVL